MKFRIIDNLTILNISRICYGRKKDREKEYSVMLSFQTNQSPQSFESIQYLFETRNS